MANDMTKIDPETGEVMTITESNTPLAVQLAQAELNQAVTTARAFPRSIALAVRNISSLATLDEETAAENVYALPRGGKPIKGPSVRFAEIVASQWGNCHTGARVIAVDKFEKVVIAEGVFFDLETGMKRTAQIRRRIVDSKGRLYNDDMITVTGNAAASIAFREAVLKGIPKAVWRKAYDHCEKVIAGDVATVNERREKAITAFAVWGIKPEQIFAALEVGGLDDIGLDELATLTAMHKSIKSGEETVERYFPAKANAEDAVAAAKGTAGKLADIAKGEGQQDGQTQKADDKPAETGKGGGKGKAGAKPKDADKAAEQAQDAGGEASGDQGGQSNADDGAPGSFEPEEIEAAVARGAEAKRKGMGRKTLPPEWRGEGWEPLADAWVKGWTETAAE